jgi:hypothetical protein
VPAEMHIYHKGGHGFVLLQQTENWMMPLLNQGALPLSIDVPYTE